MYTKEMKDFANEVLTDLEERMVKEDGNRLRDKNGNLTDYGKYVTHF